MLFFKWPFFAFPFFKSLEVEYETILVLTPQSEIIFALPAAQTGLHRPEEPQMNDDFSAIVTKKPTAERFHSIQISGWLAVGEVVTACEVVSNDPALQIDRITTPTGFIRWRVRGGVNGQDYVVTVTITTNLERKEPIFIRYRVRKPRGA